MATDPSAYVRDLAIPTTRATDAAPSQAPDLTSAQAQAFVDQASVIVFTGAISAQHKSDVLNSLLLAQLAASHKFDREKHAIDWYNGYREVLENIGWAITGFEFTEYDAPAAEFTADKVVVELLGTIATGNEVAAAAAAMKAANSLADDSGALHVFEQSSHSLQAGNFQVSAVSELNGLLGLKLAAFYFETVQQVTTVLWFHFSKMSTSFHSGAQAVTLDDDVYATVRSAITQKLGDNAATFVRNLPDFSS